MWKIKFLPQTVNIMVRTRLLLDFSVSFKLSLDNMKMKPLRYASTSFAQNKLWKYKSAKTKVDCFASK